jgi:hypothetical protein
MLCAVPILLLCSCGKIEIMTESRNPYSRDVVAERVSSVGFGYRMVDDDIYTILDNVYHDKSLAERFGDAFEVEDMGGGFEGSINIPFLWEGKGRYGFTIDGVHFSATIEKPLFGKLVVTGIEEDAFTDAQEN